MNESKLAAPALPTIDHKPHATFFRQSGWLMMAAVAGGVMTYAVHLLNKRISDAEYTAFVLLMMVISCVPTAPLQMVFTQQSAEALAHGRERQLARLIRMTWLWTTVIWLIVVVAVFIFQKQIVAGWKLPGAGCLWMAVVGVLLSLWSPLFGGLLQGRQDFFWLGWSSICGGVARLIIAVLLVLALSLGAEGMLIGVLVGVGLCVLIAIWRTRDLWWLVAEKFDAKNLWRQATPLLLGFAACQFMFTSDTMFTKAHFSDEAMKPYAIAGTLARALLWLVMPLASVMFPKIVHSRVRAEESNLLGLVVVGTAVLSICGALGLWLVGPWIVRFVAHSSDVAGTMALIPWYAGAMVPLALANVLVNHLLAHSRFGVVPLMVLLAIAYGLTLPLVLNRFPGHLQVALQTLGVFNLLLFLLCAIFTWGKNTKTMPVH